MICTLCSDQKCAFLSCSKNPPRTKLKMIKCISNICSNRYHRNCDFTCSYQLFVICIIFYQCFFTKICTLCSGHKRAFIISISHRLTGKQVLESVTTFRKINHDYIAVLLGKLPSILFLLPRWFVFINKLHLLGKGSSSLIQTYGFGV